jgi:hypothetical protein
MSVSPGYRGWQVSLAALALVGAAGCSREVIVGSLPGASLPAVSTACDSSAPPGVSKIATLHPETSSPLFLQGDTLLVGQSTTTGSFVMQVPLAGGTPTLFRDLTPMYFTMGGDVITQVFADATNLYWVMGFDLLSTPLAGGGWSTLGEYIYNPVAWDTENAYWVTSLPDTALSLQTAPLAGSAATELAPLSRFVSLSQGIAVDDDSVYWTEDIGDTWEASTVVKMPKAGGPAVTIASGQLGSGAVALDAENVYWLNVGPFQVVPPIQPSGPFDSRVATVPKAGGAPQALAPGLYEQDDFRNGLIVRGAYVYWVQNQAFWGGTNPPPPSKLMRVPVAGGTPEVIADLSSYAADPPIACPGGICWAAYDTPDEMVVLRFNACP